MSKNRTIVHVDMDAFFAMVEKREDPKLEHKPVIVGGMSGRGVVSTACYIAREYGVHSAMPVARARHLCPEAVFIPVRGEHYRQVSKKIMQVLRSFAPEVEPVSLDEAFLDVTGVIARYENPGELGRNIKGKIQNKLNLTASVGIGPNKMLAKLASEKSKPDGLLSIEKKSKDNFLRPLPVAAIWGIGEKTAARLQKLGIKTIADLQDYDTYKLRSVFDERALVLKQRGAGIDPSPVDSGDETKSVSNEQTFSEDITDSNRLKKKLFRLTEKVARRLRSKKLEGRTVEVKLRRGDFTTITRRRTLHQPTAVTEQLWETSCLIFEDEMVIDDRGVRLLGMGVSNLSRRGEQKTLFDSPEDKNRKKLNELLDSINREYGPGTIGRGRTF